MPRAQSLPRTNISAVTKPNWRGEFQPIRRIAVDGACQLRCASLPDISRHRRLLCISQTTAVERRSFRARIPDNEKPACITAIHYYTINYMLPALVNIISIVTPPSRQSSSTEWTARNDDHLRRTPYLMNVGKLFREKITTLHEFLSLKHIWSATV